MPCRAQLNEHNNNKNLCFFDRLVRIRWPLCSSSSNSTFRLVIIKIKSRMSKKTREFVVVLCASAFHNQSSKSQCASPRARSLRLHISQKTFFVLLMLLFIFPFEEVQATCHPKIVDLLLLLLLLLLHSFFSTLQLFFRVSFVFFFFFFSVYVSFKLLK